MGDRRVIMPFLSDDELDSSSSETLQFPLGRLYGAVLTLCDPSYLTDNRGRLVYGEEDDRKFRHGPFADAAVDELPLADGEWSAHAVVGDGGIGWGRRIWESGITLEGHEPPHRTAQIEQGVDSAMVGYFIDRPEVGYEDVFALVDDGKGVGLRRDSSGSLTFATKSGYGDGVYQATVGWQDDRIISVLLDMR